MVAWRAKPFKDLKPNCSEMISINKNNISGAMMSLVYMITMRYIVYL